MPDVRSLLMEAGKLVSNQWEHHDSDDHLYEILALLLTACVRALDAQQALDQGARDTAQGQLFQVERYLTNASDALDAISLS